MTPVPFNSPNWSRALFAQPVHYVLPGAGQASVADEGVTPFFEQQSPEVNGPPLGRYGLPSPETSSWLSDDMTKWIDPYGAVPLDNFELQTGSWGPEYATPGSFGINVQYNAFIPLSKGQPLVNGPAGSEGVHFGLEPGQIKGYRVIGGPFAPPIDLVPTKLYYFSTDNRELAGQPGTSRLSMYTTTPIDSMRIGNLVEESPHYFAATAGESHRVLASVAQPLTYTAGDLYDTKRAYASFSGVVRNVSPTSSYFTVSASAGYPFIVSPKIDMTMDLHLERLATGLVHIWGSASHDFFPAYEIVVNGAVIHQYYPTAPGPSIFNLTSGQSYSIDVNLDSTGHVVERNR